MKKLDEPKIGGTLDIGAADVPIPQATIAADINVPAKPRKKPFKRPIKVIVDKTSEGPLGMPLKLTKHHRLRLYWAGDARDLPNEWEGRLSTIYSGSAVGVHPGLSTAGMGKEMFATLKPGGKVKLKANSRGVRGVKAQAKENKNHIKHVKAMLKAGGFKNVKVTGDFKGGFFTFTAEKPMVRQAPTRRLRITPRYQRITPKRPRLRK